MVALAAGSLDPAAARTTPVSAGISNAVPGSRRSSARSSSGWGPSGLPYLTRTPVLASTRGISVLLWYAAMSSSGSTVTRASGPNVRMTCGTDGAAWPR